MSKHSSPPLREDWDTSGCSPDCCSSSLMEATRNRARAPPRVNDVGLRPENASPVMKAERKGTSSIKKVRGDLERGVRVRRRGEGHDVFPSFTSDRSDSIIAAALSQKSVVAPVWGRVAN